MNEQEYLDKIRELEEIVEGQGNLLRQLGEAGSKYVSLLETSLKHSGLI